MRGEVLEIPEGKSSVGLDAKPGLEPAPAQFIGQKRNEFSQLLLVALLDLLPIDEHASGPGIGEFFSQFFGKGLLRLLVSECQRLHSLGNPLVAEQVGKHRHQLPFSRAGQFLDHRVLLLGDFA